MKDEQSPIPPTPAPADAAAEQRLVQRAGRGDRAALAELASRYERTLLGLARGLLSGRDDLAADAVQDAWLRVIRSGSSFGGASSVKTWLYRIVINRCHDLRAAHDNAARSQRIIDHHAHKTEHTLDANDSAQHTETIGTVRDAVAKLKDDQRLLVLRYHQGMTHTQAADILNIPVGTVKSRLNTILNELRSVLKPEHAP